MRYAAPTTTDEALELLRSDPDSQVFAGATDLIPQIRAGRPEPSLLVDLKRIERLVAVSHDNGTWTVGAATPTSALTANAEFSSAFPGLSEASGLIGSDQIQNRSSWGGNLCNASPAADSAPALIVNDARAVIAGASGERTAAAADIVTGPGETSLAAGEFIIEFLLDDPPAGSSDAYLRLIPRTEMDIAVVGAAVQLTLDGDRVASAKVALGAVAPTVVRVPGAEAALAGSTLDDDTLAAVSAAASDACNPIDDKRGTIQYRRQVAGVLARRAAQIAAQRARSQPTQGNS
ncbi:MAG: xanthine dehydrogenase family protein subunit M [Acidimicrobiaceae bacterium]|nr:xanthine dehydrogenase family protein subunit M [Acidimicrobiaceae bacterium]MDE0607401.1 xanthine dehydrogenase family protein subunit M [Acidimicrobiaceae bacterium]